ncbi:MAG: type VI secretion system tube protein TssD [Suipraeoptans sp.]
MFNIPQTIAHIVAKLFLDGKEYEVAYFDIFFSQDVDHKGKPQHEVGGGLFKVVLKDTISDSIYDWAKRSTKKKSGKIIFSKELVSSDIIILFEDAYCISLTRQIDSFTGTTTTLIISPKTISLNNILHDNGWKE